MALMQTLLDSFAGSFDASKWNEFETSATVAQASGQVTVTPAISTSGSNYAGYVSDALYDMTASYAFMDITTVTNTSSNAQTYFKIATSSTQAFIFLKEKNRLYIMFQSGASAVTIVSTPYNAITHKYLRFRHDNALGRLYYEYSSDNVTYTSFTWSNILFPITSMWAEFGAGTYQSEASPGTAVFNSFNTVSYDIGATLAGSSTITADVEVEVEVSATLSGTATLEATLSTQVNLSTIDRKSYMYKIYDPDNNYLGIWQDVVSEFAYSQEINNAGSAIDVELARNSDTRFIAFDDLLTEAGDNITTESGLNITTTVETTNAIGEGTLVDLNLNVQIYVFYGQQGLLTTESEVGITTEAGVDILVDNGPVNGQRIFTGFISKYVTRYGDQENTLVSIFSHGAELDNYVIEAGGFTQIDFFSYDPSDIVRGVLDLYNGTVSYSDSSIENTDTTVSYTFRLNTTLEGIQKSLELAPPDWFYYLDMGENNIYFKERPVNPQHYFLLGKHVESLNLERYIEDIVNVVYFTGGEVSPGVNLFKKYEDTDSIAAYRQGLERISDNRVTLESSAEIISQTALDRGKEPRYRSNIEITAATYDIETIRLGDLIAFRNFGNYVDTLTMQVVRLDYTPDSVTLQLDTLLPSVPKRLQDIYRNLDALDNANTPDAPS